MEDAEFQTLVHEVLGTDVGLVVFGEEQDKAMIKPRTSLVTLGIELPTIETL